MLPGLSAEKKVEERKPGPPQITFTRPLVVSPGIRIALRIRGNDLTNVTRIEFTDRTGPIVLGKASVVDLPKDADPVKVGGHELEVEIGDLGSAPFTNHFVAVSPLGRSVAHPLFVLPESMLVKEREPNGGFRQAQLVNPGVVVMGAIQPGADVDVYEIRGEPGEEVRVAVVAASLGSPLDPWLTAYDERGNIVASADDESGSRDSAIQLRFPTAGVRLVSVTDALDRGGAGHDYLLFVERAGAGSKVPAGQRSKR